MSQPLMTIDVDHTALFRAMDRSVEAIERGLKRLASETADRVVAGAQQRVARATGATAQGIHKEETHDGTGYVVLPSDWTIAWHTRRKTGRSHTQKAHSGVPRWLEFGTQTMSARPFFFQAARLEENAYARRAQQVAADAIAESGLGE